MRIKFAIVGVIAGGLTLMEGTIQGQTPSALPTSVTALSWMSGSWGGTQGAAEMEEHWTTAKGGSMIGMHRDVVKGRTVSFEFLRIEEQGGGLVYLASPKGQPATPFHLAEAGPARAVFANPQHDFPQRIIYWKDGADLRARIEGPQGGKTVGEEWRWSRLTCLKTPVGVAEAVLAPSASASPHGTL